MGYYQIKGHYPTEDGYLGERGTLLVEKTTTGWILPDMAARSATLTAREHLAATGGPVCVEISLDRLAWTFWPDAGECERIGLPVSKLQEGAA